ncbi:acid-sensitive two pore domain K+ channel dTASK-7, putative, partial [Ixodes scapularis]
YGNIAPKTNWGKMVTILYAIVGIPLMLLYLTNIGDILARAFKYAKMDGFAGAYFDDVDFEERPRVTVPILLCMTIISGYICGGAVLFSIWEDWNYLDGSYFCFVTLSTIGFGDLVPGDTVVSDSGSQEKLVICSLYLLVGLALIAMCFNLVQEE